MVGRAFVERLRPWCRWSRGWILLWHSVSSLVFPAADPPDAAILLLSQSVREIRRLIRQQGRIHMRDYLDDLIHEFLLKQGISCAPEQLPLPIAVCVDPALQACLPPCGDASGRVIRFPVSEEQELRLRSVYALRSRQ